MKTYKIYTKGNYIVIVDVIKNEYFYGIRKDVHVDKSNTNRTGYRIFNVKDWQDTLVINLDQLLKEDGSPYSESEFDTFYQENTGNFNGGGTAPTDNIIKVTRLEAETLQTTSSFVPGATYTITNADVNLYGGTEITLTAITPSELSLQGSGLFYCPKYDLSAPSTGYGIFNNYMEGTITNVVGELLDMEVVQAQNGAEAIYLSDGLLQWVSGDWSAAVNIFGASGSADVSGFITPSYNVDDIVHWGGKSWKNLYGDIGVPDSKYLLDYNWEEIPFSEVDYNVFIDEIQYDFFTDMIIYRKDKYNNVVSCNSEVIFRFKNLYGNPIKDFQWGCAVDSTNQYAPKLQSGIFGNAVINSYFETLNSPAKLISLNTSTELSESFQNIIFKDSYLTQNQISNGSSIKTIVLYKYSFIQRNVLESNSVFQQQNLSNGSYVLENRISSLSIFSNNKLQNGSSIKNNTLDTVSKITNTKTKEGNYIANNSLSNSLITENVMDSFSSISGNNLKSDSKINTNALGSGSGIQINTFINGTELSYNNIPSDKLVNNNSASNSILKFSNISEDITAIAANNFNTSSSTIDLTGSTLLQTTYSKTLFTNSAGVNRLQYVNNSDVIVITNVNA